MIGILNLGKDFGPQKLFEGVTLQLNARSRYGVVGANGSGKSTFLKILTGDEPPSEGEVTFPRHARLGVLRQDRFLSDDQVILDVAMMGDEIAHGALKEQEALAEQDAPDPARLGEVDELINAHDGYTLEARASEVLMGLGLAQEVLKNPLRTLSGGFKLRVLLAQVLVGRPDALLLDEPTNHLDILSIRWLERFLSNYEGCTVVVSHDHRFLNNVATHILDVDYGTILQYTGNYDAFGQQKAAIRDQKEAEIAKVERIVAEKKAFVERFKAKASKARQAQSRVKQIEKIEVQELPQSSRRYPSFNFDLRRASGKDVLIAEEVSKAYGDKRVLENVSVSVRREEHVAVIGANGLGKSTLLKILVGAVAQDRGKVTWGHEAQVGYFAQDHKEQLTVPEKSVLDCLWDTCPQEGTGFVRGVLGRLLFSGKDVEKKVGHLSGGEATRLVFSRLMVQKPNVLVLDEPTNHLDLEAIEALVSALKSYEGTLLFVSHDRWFVSQLATRIIEIRADGLQDFPGTYDEYLAAQGDDHLDRDQAELRAKREQRDRKDQREKQDSRGKGKSNRARDLPKQRDAVMARIEQIEQRLGVVHAEYAEPGFFQKALPDQVERLRREEQDLNAEQQRLLHQWEALELDLQRLDAAN